MILSHIKRAGQHPRIQPLVGSLGPGVTGPVKGRAASSGSYPMTGPAPRRLHGAGWRNGGTATLITCNHLKLAATPSGRQANSGKDWLSRQWREQRTGRGLRPSEGRGHRFESCRVRQSTALVRCFHTKFGKVVESAPTIDPTQCAGFYGACWRFTGHVGPKPGFNLRDKARS